MPEIPFTLKPFSVRKGATIFPFDQMKRGDWFKAKRNGKRRGHADFVQMQIARSAYNWRVRNHPERRFSVRIEDESYVRCERVK